MAQANGQVLQADKAQEALWLALQSGQIRGGQFLSMSQLVDLLECPIASIREAVKLASSHGLLTTLPKRGIQVMDVTPDATQQCLDFRMVLDQEGARRRIADNNFEGLEALHQEHRKMADAISDGAAPGLPQDAIKVDLSLHDFLADGLGNPQLIAAYDANRMRIAIIQNARPFLRDRIASAMQEHLDIIGALTERDEVAAARAIRYHHDQTMRWWGIV